MRKTTNLQIGTIYLLLMLSSCSAITTSQKAVIEEYSTAAKSYSEAPKELLAKYRECKYNSGIFEASTKHVESDMIDKLNASSKDYFATTAFASDLGITYQLMGKYFQALLDFVGADSSKDFKSNMATLGTNIDSLISKGNDHKFKTIPIGFGSIGASLVQYIGKRNISHKQLKYFKDFMIKGDTLIETLSVILNGLVINSLINGELSTGDANLKPLYLLFLANLDSSDKKTGALYKELNPQYLELKNCFGQGILLAKKISEATTKITAAHKELIMILSTKQSKIKTKDIAVFVDEANQIADLIKQFSNSK
jgi:hypothetical protein